MRNDLWLREQLQFLLDEHFNDVLLTNPIEIKFGREAKYRFGSIKLIRRPKSIRDLIKRGSETPEKSIITITSMFAKEDVPVDVVRYTIGHELTHYAHGFSSSNKRMFKYPHHGGIVNRELADRKAEKLVRAFKTWLKEYRKKILSHRTGI